MNYIGSGLALKMRYSGIASDDGITIFELKRWSESM